MGKFLLIQLTLTIILQPSSKRFKILTGCLNVTTNTFTDELTS